MTTAFYFLGGSLAIFSTICGAFASGGNRVRFHLVPPVLPADEQTAKSVVEPSATVGAKKTPVKDNKMVQAIAFYKSGEIIKAIPVFQEVLLLEPTNAEAHYYYANCLAQQGQSDSARFEYKTSLHYSKSNDLNKYCHQALLHLANSSSVDKASTAPTNEKLVESASAGEQARAIHYDRQLERLRAEVNAEYHHKLEEKRGELNRKISKIKQEVEEEINATPKVYTAMIRTPNLNYETTIAAIQTKGENRIKILTADYQDDFRLIDETYGKRLHALASSHQNLKGQMAATVGSSQVTPAGTSFYVRNYVNYGGVQESIKPVVPASPGLRAVPGKLKAF